MALVSPKTKNCEWTDVSAFVSNVLETDDDTEEEDAINECEELMLLELDDDRTL